MKNCDDHAELVDPNILESSSGGVLQVKKSVAVDYHIGCGNEDTSSSSKSQSNHHFSDDVNAPLTTSSMETTEKFGSIQQNEKDCKCYIKSH